jgi:hypothetical protein
MVLLRMPVSSAWLAPTRGSLLQHHWVAPLCCSRGKADGLMCRAHTGTHG